MDFRKIIGMLRQIFDITGRFLNRKRHLMNDGLVSIEVNGWSLEECGREK